MQFGTLQHGLSAGFVWYRIARDVMCGPPRNLVESCAHAIAQQVLSHFPRVCAVHVTVRKPHVAIDGVLESLGKVLAGWGGRFQGIRSHRALHIAVPV